MSDILQAARSYYGLADTESCTTQLFTNQAGQTCVAFEIALSNEDFEAIVQRMQNMQQPDTQPDTAIIEGPTVESMREAYNALSKAEKGRYGSFARYMAESSTGIIDVYTGEPYKTLEFEGIKVEDATHNQQMAGYKVACKYGVMESRAFRLVDEMYEAFRSASQQSGNPGELPSADIFKDIEWKERQVVHVDAPEEPEPVSMDAVWIKERDVTAAQRLFCTDEKHGPHEPEYLVQWAMLTDEQKQKAKEAKP